MSLKGHLETYSIQIMMYAIFLDKYTAMKMPIVRSSNVSMAIVHKIRDLITIEQSKASDCSSFFVY